MTLPVRFRRRHSGGLAFLITYATISPFLGGLVAIPLCAQDATAPPANAQVDIAEPANLLTLETLQDLALSNNPTLNQAAAVADIARGVHQQVGLYPNPQLGYLRKDSSGFGNSKTAGVFVGQEIVTTGKRKKAQNAEAWAVEEENWGYQAQERRILNDVHLRFIDTLAAQETVKIADNLLRVTERGFKATENLFAGNQVPKSDVLQARIQLRNVQLARREALVRYRAAWKQLSAIVGLRDTTPIKVEGQFRPEFPRLDFDTTYDNLIACSPVVQAAKAKAQHWQATYQLERANATPNFNVQVVAERDSVDKFNSVSTLVSMPIPVFNRNQGNIFRAAAQTREGAAEVQRTEFALRDQLADTFRRYESAVATVEAMTVEILPDAEESLNMQLESYRGGGIGVMGVLSAQKTLIEARLSRIDAIAEAEKAYIEIDGLLLTGALNPAELGTALQSSQGGSQRRAILQNQEGSGGRGLLPAAIQGGP